MLNPVEKIEATCLVPWCEKAQHIRGLCRSHYNQIGSKIRQRDIPSWKELEKRGKVLPPKKRGLGELGKLDKWIREE